MEINSFSEEEVQALLELIKDAISFGNEYGGATWDVLGPAVGNMLLRRGLSEKYAADDFDIIVPIFPVSLTDMGEKDFLYLVVQPLHSEQNDMFILSKASHL